MAAAGSCGSRRSWSRRTAFPRTTPSGAFPWQPAGDSKITHFSFVRSLGHLWPRRSYCTKVQLPLRQAFPTDSEASAGRIGSHDVPRIAAQIGVTLLSASQGQSICKPYGGPNRDEAPAAQRATPSFDGHLAGTRRRGAAARMFQGSGRTFQATGPAGPEAGMEGSAGRRLWWPGPHPGRQRNASRRLRWSSKTP